MRYGVCALDLLMTTYILEDQIEWIWTFVQRIWFFSLGPDLTPKASMAAAKNNFHHKSLRHHMVAFVCHVQCLASHIWEWHARITGWKVFVSTTPRRSTTVTRAFLQQISFSPLPYPCVFQVREGQVVSLVFCFVSVVRLIYRVTFSTHMHHSDQYISSCNFRRYQALLWVYFGF